uniref:Zinc finger protein, FOG family member 1 n=1 Tax=Malurus cyaneus samueli TaxID=2593467 RepID=A0A8C5T544_9PASS
DESCWLSRLPLVTGSSDPCSALSPHSDDEPWCRTRALREDEPLSAFVVAEPPAVPNHGVKAEPGESPYPAALHSDIQLLPQQAGMAAILATAVVNKDVFPCKDCGIWYRSERNLQAHLMYYCASRQSAGAGSPALDEKPKETYPNERVCPFPQCKKSCPSASSLEIHMRSHSGTARRCPPCPSTWCCPAPLPLPTPPRYRHRPPRPPTPGPANSRPQPSRRTGKGLPRSSSSSSSSTSGEPVRIKEEPAGSPASEAEAPKSGEGAGSPDAGSRTSSPRSLPSAKVKSELASPTPGSSPVPSEPGTGTAGGTVFLPQYVFGHEAAVVPQASEILAKMSELVHSRLKQGHGGTVPPAIYPGTPVPKGATCFECEITFNNINNYYVHKRLYCSSRHLAEDSPPGARKLKATPGAPKGPPAPGTLLSPPAGNGQGPMAGDGDTGRDATPPATAPEGKAEEGGTKAGSPEAEGGSGRCSEDSQSPGSSAGDDGDEDPSKTLCEACNIRFSRHETYVVHKRFYCASRHDPPLRRPAAPKVPFVPQPLRTRKRRKLYEIHGAPPPPGPACPEPRPPEPPPAAPEPRASPDAEGPIDLSKKPRWQSTPAPLLPLADYHECTACRISFNSLDAYLAHKKYQCPATPLQPRRGAGQGSPGGEPRHPVPRGGLAAASPQGSPATAGGQGSPRRLSLLSPQRGHQGRPPGALPKRPRAVRGKPPAGPGPGPGRAAPWRQTPSPRSRGMPPRRRPPRLPGQRHRQGGRDSPRPPGSPRSHLARSPEDGEGARTAPTPPAYTDRAVQTPPAKAAPGPVPNGNHRYCRLCNIKFSSLSTFIAHKKYYCSSHAAEHVK